MKKLLTTILSTARRYPFSTFCVVLVWLLSLAPYFPATPLDNVRFIDKWTHFVMYGGTAAVMWLEYWRRHGRVQYVTLWLWAGLGLSFMGGLLELLQTYCTTTRNGEWLDFLADSVGALGGCFLASLIVGLRRRVAVQAVLLLAVLPAFAMQPRIGLVLGGGGAKGAAEVGVLKVLEEAGVRMDYIVGTSIGSIVGGLYASGYTAAELETLFETQEWLSLLTDRKQSLSDEPFKTIDGVTYIFGFPVIDRNSSGFGVMRGSKIEQVLDSMVSTRGCATFDKLRIPFRCVAADIRTAREVVIGDGRLSKAMRASMAIPGIFKPVERGDYMLVDGGMLNNLPVDVCRAMGADVVIAVDLQQAEQRPRKPADVGILSDIAGMLGFEGVLEWITNRPDILKYHENRKLADVYIHPNLPDADASSFGNKHAARMVRAGEDAARTQWKALQKLVQRQ